MVKDIQKICSRCLKKVHCCRFDDSDGFVFIGIKDAQNIRKRYDLRYKDFLEFRKFSKKAISSLIKSEKYSEGHMRLKQLRKCHLLVLKKKDKGCIFFDDGCRIYQYRPLICRIYPCWFFIGEKRHIISHGECSGCKALKHDKCLAVLKKDELKQLRNISKKIESEDRYYRKNIDKFVKEI